MTEPAPVLCDGRTLLRFCGVVDGRVVTRHADAFVRGLVGEHERRGGTIPDELRRAYPAVIGGRAWPTVKMGSGGIFGTFFDEVFG